MVPIMLVVKKEINELNVFSDLNNWFLLRHAISINYNYYLTLILPKESLKSKELNENSLLLNIFKFNNTIFNEMYKYEFIYLDNNKVKIIICNQNINNFEFIISLEELNYSLYCLIQILSFLSTLDLKSKLFYLWTMEIDVDIKFHVVLKIDLLDLNFLQKNLLQWNVNLNLNISLQIIEDKIKIFNYIFKLPILIGNDSELSEISLNEYKLVYYKISNNVFDLLFDRKFSMDNLNKFIKIINSLQINLGTKEKQEMLELYNLERSIKYQENTKHFYSYFGRIINNNLLFKFFSFLTRPLNEEKSQFVYKLMREDINNKIKLKGKKYAIKVYNQFLVSLSIFLYVSFRQKIEKREHNFLKQIGKIFLSLVWKNVINKYINYILEKEKDKKLNKFEVLEIIEYSLGSIICLWIKRNYSFLFTIELIRSDGISKYKVNFNDNNKVIKRLKVTRKKIYGNCPLIVKPKKWNLEKTIASENFSGGLLLNNKQFKIPLGKSKKNNILKFNTGHFIESINYLQNTAYELDTYMFDYVSNLSKETINKIILLEKELFLNVDDDNLSSQEIQSIKSKYDSWKRVLNVCKAFITLQKLYFTYQVDFRGRIYPWSDFLNYQSNKLSRSLLRFYKKKVVSNEGIYWLKISTVRKFIGNKYKSADTIIKYYDDILKKKIEIWIFEKKEEFFWLEADEPLLFLAHLFEWKRYYFSNKDNFYSGFIIYMDATCSGSQIVSLLLGIDKYAASLNLIKSKSNDLIGDYYSQIISDFLTYCCSNKYNKHKFYLLLLNMNDNQRRKLLKNIIMTINYGLTKRGLLLKFKSLLYDLNFIDKWSDYTINKFVNIFYDFLNNLVLVNCFNVLLKIAKYYISNNKDIVYNTSQKGFILKENEADISVKFPYFIKQRYKMRFSLKKGKKRNEKRGTLVFSSDERDSRKELRALRANLIHHLDSVIIYSLLLKLKKEQSLIKVVVIHDCFGITLHDISKFNIQYRQVLKELFQDTDSFINFLNFLIKDLNNKNVKNEILLQEILNEIEYLKRNYKKLLIDDIENSFYILFP